MFHVPGGELKKILRTLPRLKKPTINKITGENWYDVTISCGKKGVRELIPKLKRMGCQGIVEFPLVKLLP